MSISALGKGTRSRRRLEEEPHVDPNTETEEFSLGDRDGYYVTINAIFAV